MDLSTHHAVIYDPQRAIVVVPSLQTGGSDVLLPTGNVLISDGAAAALYDPTTYRALPQIPPAPPIPATILLEDGRALSLGNTSVVYTAQPYQNPEPVIAAVMSNTPASNSEPISLDIRGSSFLPNSFVQLGPTKLVPFTLAPAASLLLCRLICIRP